MHTLARKLVKHILSRSTEASARPDLISRLREAISTTTAFHTSAVSNQTSSSDAPQRFTSDELSNLTKLVSNATAWLEESVKKQDRLKGHEDPVLRVADLEKRIKELESEVKKLAKKKVPRAKKVKPADAKKDEGADKSKGEHKKDEL